MITVDAKGERFSPDVVRVLLRDVHEECAAAINGRTLCWRVHPIQVCMIVEVMMQVIDPPKIVSEKFDKELPYIPPITLAGIEAIQDVNIEESKIELGTDGTTIGEIINLAVPVMQ